MVDSDMIYKINLRLQEIMENDLKPFGGIAVFVFGDLMQLKPVRANYIFQTPRNENFVIPFKVDSLWNKFMSVTLTKNHRQANDKHYADILNRIRVGKLLEHDIKELRTRCVNKENNNLPEDAMYITCLNKKVNYINAKKLSKLTDELIISVAKVERNGKTIEPVIDQNTGNIRNTPLQHKLCMKKSAKVMLTFNLDTVDNLTNGAFGEILDFKYEKDGSLRTVIVKFYNTKAGFQKRKSMSNYCQDNSGTPIERIEFTYNLSKKSEVSTSGTVQQFPLKLSFAATAHKVQGQTIKKPCEVILDLESVRESAQGYVMLSRVEDLTQLYIDGNIFEEKLTHNEDAKTEMDNLFKSSLKSFVNVNRSEITLSTINIRSLHSNFNNLLKNLKNLSAYVICVQETWLDTSYDYSNAFNVPEMDTILNSVGRGRGIATFTNKSYNNVQNINNNCFQISVLSFNDKNVINVYRSSDANNVLFIQALIGSLQLIHTEKKETFLCGDLNLCSRTESDHVIIQEILKLGFHQLVKYPTHEKGRYLDHIYVLNPSKLYEVVHISHALLDHDFLSII